MSEKSDKIPQEIRICKIGNRPEIGEIIPIEASSPLCNFLHVSWSGKCHLCGQNAFVGHVPLLLTECDTSFPLQIGDAVMLAAAVSNNGIVEGYKFPKTGTVEALCQDDIIEVIDWVTEQGCKSSRRYWQVAVPYSFHSDLSKSSAHQFKADKECKFSEEFYNMNFNEFLKRIKNCMN